MVVECVVAGRQRGAGDDCRPAVGHEQRRPEGDVDQAGPPEERVGRDAEDPRTDVVFEPAQADDDGLGDEHDGRAAGKQRHGRPRRPRQRGVGHRHEADGDGTGDVDSAVGHGRCWDRNGFNRSGLMMMSRVISVSTGRMRAVVSVE